jgi:spore germination cell wall hydrolase CwlJ-like protein
MKRILMAIVALSLCTTPTQAAPIDQIISAINVPRYTEQITENIRETLCLSLNVYHEARGSTRQDQIGVAWVTKNRATRSGRSLCRTIWEPGQFSWTPRSTSSLMPREMAAWHRAVQVSRLVMADELADPTGGARNFRAARMGGGRGYRVIGAHAYW